MPDDKPVDYYEVLQVSSTAEPETIHRVYRLHAQRYHPDNQETGNRSRFEEIRRSLQRAQRPRAPGSIRHRLLEAAPGALAPHLERGRVGKRLRVRAARSTDAPRGSLHPTTDGARGRRGLLDGSRGPDRQAPRAPGIHDLVLGQKKFLQRDDSSRLIITAEGVEFLEQNYRANLQRKRLPEARNPS